MKLFHVLLIIIVIVIVNIFIWMYLQRKTKREQSDDINQRISVVMHTYFALSDHDATFEQDEE